MPTKLGFNIKKAHKYFAVECFNRAWDLIDKTDRTAEKDEEMIRLSLASAWHWTQRPDCTSTNKSITYWQTARVYALLKQADNARRYGLLCLEASRGEDILPFYLGYAYEALARAEMVAGNHEKMREYFQQARQVSERMVDPEAKNMLLADLDTIK